MKNFFKFLIFVSIFAILLLPVFSHAYSLGDPIVPPCGPDPVTGTGCVWGFTELIILVNNIIYFVLFGLALPISAIMFAYAGFLMLTAGGSTENVSKAKKIFSDAAIGLAVAAAAWLIVNTIMMIFQITPGDWSWIGFN